VEEGQRRQHASVVVRRLFDARLYQDCIAHGVEAGMADNAHATFDRYPVASEYK
jgi:hypothetical protein